MKKLEILVPRYNESPEVAKPLFDSIALQQNVNFDELGVIVCDDGSDELLPDDFFGSYPYEVKYIAGPHEGVSAARQTCLDAATADYVTFADIDDLYYNACGLWIVEREMRGDGFEMLISSFIEETRTSDGEPTYITHNNDSTFVHGKVYNREFLIKNNIAWNKNLTVHEDSYFCTLARECISKKEMGKYCPTPFFLWKWRDASVCRRDPAKYVLNTYPAMIESNSALINSLIERGKTESAQYYVANMVFDAYYSMNRKDFLNIENQDYKRRVEERFREYYNEFSELFYSLDENERNAIGNTIRTRMIKENTLSQEIITLSGWLTQF